MRLPIELSEDTLVSGFNQYMNGSSLWPVYREPGRAGVVTIHPPPGWIPMSVGQRPPYLPQHQHYDAYYYHHYHAAPGYHHHSYGLHPYHPPPQNHLPTQLTAPESRDPPSEESRIESDQRDDNLQAYPATEAKRKAKRIESDQRDDNLQAYHATEAKRKAKRARIESDQRDHHSYGLHSYLLQYLASAPMAQQRTVEREKKQQQSVEREKKQQQSVEREKKQQQYLAIEAQQRAVEREKKQQQYLAKSQTIDVSSLVDICLRRNIKIGIYYEEQINHMQAELTERIVDKYRSIFESMNEEKRTLLEELGSSYDRVLHTPKPGFDSVVIRCIEIGIPECEMKWYLRLHGEYNSVPFIGNSSDDRLLNYLRKDTYKVKRTTWIMGKRDKNKATPRNVQDVFSEANIQKALAATRTVFLHLGHANPNESAEKGRCKLSSQLQTVEL